MTARPLPLRATQINAAGVGARKPDRTLAILARVAAECKSDVILACEVANLRDMVSRGERILPEGWEYAYDASDASKAGVMIAWHTDRIAQDGEVTWHLGTEPRRWGRRVRMRSRWWLAVPLVVDPGERHRWHIKMAEGHAPPKRFWAVLWDRFVRNVPNVEIMGADWNRLERVLRRRMHETYRFRMVRIDGFAVRRWIEVSEPERTDVGSDHPAVTVTFWPSQR